MHEIKKIQIRRNPFPAADFKSVIELLSKYYNAA